MERSYHATSAPEVDPEDGVFIGAGARVLGDIRIGRRAIIGANAVVLESVPDDAVVAGVPARVIRIQKPSGE